MGQLHKPTFFSLSSSHLCFCPTSASLQQEAPTRNLLHASPLNNRWKQKLSASSNTQRKIGPNYSPAWKWDDLVSWNMREARAFKNKASRKDRKVFYFFTMIPKFYTKYRTLSPTQNRIQKPGLYTEPLSSFAQIQNPGLYTEPLDSTGQIQNPRVPHRVPRNLFFSRVYDELLL